MDPLSITGAVVGLTATCLQTAKALHDIKDKYQNAQLTISAIITESTIISASLSRIQTSILGNPDGVTEKLKRPDLETTLDAALTGCYVVFDVLEAEIQKLTEASGPELSGFSGVMTRARYVWSESAMQEILGQIRGLQTALTLLLQLLGTDTMAELKHTMDNNTAVLAQVVQRTAKFRASKTSRAPGSIFDMSFMTQSIHSGDNTSMISSTFFTFDDELVNSQAYRRTLARANAAIKEEEREQRNANDNTEASTRPRPIRPPSSPKAQDEEHQGDDALSNKSTDNVSTVSDSLQTLTISDTPILSPTPLEPLNDFMSGRRYRENVDWATMWKLKKEDVNGKDKSEIERQNILCEIVSGEEAFLRTLLVLRYLYKQRWMLALDLNRGGQALFFPGCEDIYHANKTLLFDPMVARESSEGPWVSGYSDIFRNWLVQSFKFYLQYSASYPRVVYDMKTEAAKNARFSRFLEQSRDHELSQRINWETCLKSPITRLQRYSLLLQVVRKASSKLPDNTHHLIDLDRCIEELKYVLLECDVIVSKFGTIIDVVALRASSEQLSKTNVPEGSKIQFRTDMEYKESRLRAPTSVHVIVLRAPEPIVLVLQASKVIRYWRGEHIDVTIDVPPVSGKARAGANPLTEADRVRDKETKCWLKVGTPAESTLLLAQNYHAANNLRDAVKQPLTDA